MNRQINAPLYEALMKIKRNHFSLHVPGHKGGHDFDTEGHETFRSVLEIDQTEIEGLDDLHHAQGIIREAEQLAADAFGSEETKFLVGGTTSGILTLILAVIREGDQCLIERNSHKSVFNGLRLARGTPIFLTPNFDPDTGVPDGVKPEQVDKALSLNPAIKAVLITSPNYYGQTADIGAIAMIAHRFGVPLLVDEAHGAHYRFSHDLPLTALEQGADAVIQSTHKTLPAMTMSSMLHLQGDRIDRHRVRRWLAAIQSSSPSYPLLASLDLARRHMMVGEGVSRLEQSIVRVKKLRAGLATKSWLQIAPTDDPLRMVVLLPRGWSRKLQKHLQQKGIYPEIVEPDRLVFIFSGGNSSEDFEHIDRAIHSFAVPHENGRVHNKVMIPEQLWVQDFSDQNDLDKTEWCPLVGVQGRIAAAMVIPYPPGIPLILERQIIRSEVVQVLEEMIKEGIHLQGVENKRMLVYV